MNAKINAQLPILLIDDDPIVLEVSVTALESEGVTNVLTLSDSRNIIKFLENNPVSMIVLDLLMPHVSGMEILPVLIRDYPHIPVIVMTSSDDIDTAVSCIKAGATDYLTKPMDIERLLLSVEKALQVSELSTENRNLRTYLLNDCLQHPEAFGSIVTVSKKMRAIFQYIEVIAKSDQPVLITGETGVGKELIARVIATLSQRSGAFVTVNAAGLDDNMFSDTLFGHKKGAFTGADQSRDGLVSAAEKGTLFLDEIGDLNETSQVKLLRLIQEQEFYPVGSDLLKKTDARLIVATNKDLTQLITAGTFRKDLYYRLCAHHIHLPPLSERREDIPVLLDHFLDKACKALNKPKPQPSREVAALLSTYHFQGNVRELHAMVFDAVARYSAGLLTLDCFAGLSRGDCCTNELVKLLPANKEVDEALYSFFGRFPTIREVEDYLISSAMNLTGGNQRSASTLLGIARQTLSKRLSGPGDRESGTRDQGPGTSNIKVFYPSFKDFPGP
ncbi:sigma-54 dependent transcriptional regulator [Geobacter sp. SVR]|uniref:sigma-54-dependent transcriptional regulator n=1 Tax=Geobacter sp. SVR TaxID=2495594 RepID=UPI00143EF7EF|nr:sigma-54 dependent transcriptional regulator [Geobacter sp. SVR]BCS54995.1 sigma-54-dependent Fis family transcriptional regulator [Geobacter sp. SVR]GCF85177.1 sigma-54-dependent Fis family transcriptional regulator [Geobacter sp. SVR]